MEEQLVNKFFMIMEDLKKFFSSKNNVGGLSKSEFSTLHLIKQYEKDGGNVTTSALSERLQISKPAISQMINILENKQYIQRIINKNDRRLIYVVLTELGHQMIEIEMKNFLNIVDLILDEMGKKDSELFIELLEKYVFILKKITKKE